MNYLRMGFSEAVEHLAERFHVPLVTTSEPLTKGPSKAKLKEILEEACRFYHFLLLYSEEGHEALSYLYSRGIDLSFIQRFELGYAPKQRDSLWNFACEKNLSEELLEEAGLIKRGERRSSYDFFSDRILIPIRDAMGSVIAFSGRKFRETTGGGKYVNTPETILFKKSHVLFGLSYSRKRIAKEKKAIIVEGQFDAFRLIDMGFDFTVAGQGTAFGEGHVQELIHLGVQEVNLALDSDRAGQEAACKIGDLFQRKGIGVYVMSMPPGSDPDSFLKENGPIAFEHLLKNSKDYLSFVFTLRSKEIDLTNPALKSALIEELAKQIRAWNHPVMVFESLRELAKLANVPQETLGTFSLPPSVIIKKAARVGGPMRVDPDRVLEIDLLRWVLLAGPEQEQILKLIERNVSHGILRDPFCRKIFEVCMKEREQGRSVDLLRLGGLFEEKEDPQFISEILQKKINLLKTMEGCKETIKAILERIWLSEMESIKLKIQSGTLSDEEAFESARCYAQIRKTPPKIKDL
jgi:DNA primase